MSGSHDCGHWCGDWLRLMVDHANADALVVVYGARDAHEDRVEHREPKPLTDERIEEVRKRSQLASMVDARVVRDLLATVNALKAELVTANDRLASLIQDAEAHSAEIEGFKAKLRLAVMTTVLRGS